MRLSSASSAAGSDIVIDAELIDVGEP